MKIRRIVNATFVALILFLVNVVPFKVFEPQSVLAESGGTVHRIIEKRNPGFVIWEDPNKPNYYAYSTSMLTGNLESFHFHKNEYGDGRAFVRIGHDKPTTDPSSGATLNPKNLRLVEVRPDGHDAFLPSRVKVEHSDTRVLIKIDGVDFTRTPYKEVNNEHNKGTWGYHGDDGIYSENHHIRLELEWEYTEAPSTPPSYGCPAGGSQTSVTAESGRIYYACYCSEYGCAICVEKYYETVSMNVSLNPSSTVKAGQGTEISVETYYTNDFPYHYGRPYAPSNVYTTGHITEEYPTKTLKTVNMITPTSSPAYAWDTTVYWNLPYAMIDADGNWTMTENKYEADNFVNSSIYNFGGLQRWYVGFDVPDNEVIEFTVETSPSGYNNIVLCDNKTITVKGSPYDEFFIRTVDPNNPFPTGEVGLNWQGKEHLITDLKEWYNETNERYNQGPNKELRKNIFEYMRENLLRGLGNILD